MEVSWNRGTPKSSHFNGIFHYQPSIWWYPPFMEAAYVSICIYMFFFFIWDDPIHDTRDHLPHLHPGANAGVECDAHRGFLLWPWFRILHELLGWTFPAVVGWDLMVCYKELDVLEGEKTIVWFKPVVDDTCLFTTYLFWILLLYEPF